MAAGELPVEQHPPPVCGNQRVSHDRLPKSRAGVRTVAFPATLVPELREHLDTYAEPDITALVFTGQRGGVLRGATSARHPAGLMPWPRSGSPGCIS